MKTLHRAVPRPVLKGPTCQSRGGRIYCSRYVARNANLFSQAFLKNRRKSVGTDGIINTLRCYMNISPRAGQRSITAAKSWSGYDAVIPRIGASVTFTRMAVLRPV
jgi:hypothetical protein